ncbi:unnamed protein product [Blepharisma stoltei]|uniref:ATP synthase F0 subunit 8 n=1 Tax=Blepharisma stoltei TaxID=1481888 RepID=A0AAU9IK95_9CILI|nr:unnamed protein product [Blepharisma stoltei]
MRKIIILMDLATYYTQHLFIFLIVFYWVMNVFNNWLRYIRKANTTGSMTANLETLHIQCNANFIRKLFIYCILSLFVNNFGKADLLAL